MLSLMAVLVMAVPAWAASHTQTLPNGCTITATNSYGSNHAVASTYKAGGTCYTVNVRFQYWNPNTGTYQWVDSGYQNAPSVSRDAYTPVKPSQSNHNAQATSGGVKWGFPLNF